MKSKSFTITTVVSSAGSLTRTTHVITVQNAPPSTELITTMTKSKTARTKTEPTTRGSTPSPPSSTPGQRKPSKLSISPSLPLSRVTKLGSSLTPAPAARSSRKTSTTSTRKISSPFGFRFRGSISKPRPEYSRRNARSVVMSRPTLAGTDPSPLSSPNLSAGSTESLVAT